VIRHKLDIKAWYNGYSWDGYNFVYNPFSVMSFLDTSQFRNFWFSTGTPTFLIKLLKERKQINFERIYSAYTCCKKGGIPQ